jgi:hypothetical protein
MEDDDMTDDYRAMKALSAGMAWTMVTECPAQAWYESPWNPEFIEKNGEDLDVGTMAHIAVLEPHLFDERVAIITANDWRTQAARNLRQEAYAEGKVPLLEKQFHLVTRLRLQLWESAAAELLFGADGMSEHAWEWEWDGVPCKAKVDRFARIGRGMLVDLKTAATPSPAAFQREMVLRGHHLRAAWYLDGWDKFYGDVDCYRFVVIGKAEPHLISVYQLDDSALQRGRTLYRHALSLFRQCQDAGVWPGYEGQRAAGEKNTPITINLPAWYLNLHDARERAGEFEEEVSYE